MLIKNKILVMSGKGGVGKSTVAVNLAYSLSLKNHKVGLLDIDIHGPNIPKMLNLEKDKLMNKNNKIFPISAKNNLKVMSMAFMLQNDYDAIIWRGPAKHGVIKQFVHDVEWGNLDYLIVDLPPGTGDEPLSIAQILNPVTGSVIVSTPQQVALLDAMKAVTFSKKMNVPVIGVIENMSGNIFGKGGAEKAANKLKVPFLGRIKLNEQIVKSGDSGKPFVLDKEFEETESFEKIVNKIIKFGGTEK
ncbi:Mrp/NBP35 family ATP-binding protein [Candidatus Woesearchaeota archaeon]|nr:Mrp/NBP35 family ATP-binding protein [Candidatus Woesearchaeota archaeon]